MSNIKKFLLSILSLALLTAFTGCGSSIQNIAIPDIHKPLSNTESIIQLKRMDYFTGSARRPDVVANDKFIGELANDDELVWKTKANTFECISLDYYSYLVEMILGTRMTLDSIPFSYKCFFTKPKEVLQLNFDLMYPNMRDIHPIAFIPIFKNINKSKATPIAIDSITNSVKTESTNDLVESLKEAMKKQFKDNLVSSSNKTIDLEILDYKTGNAALRWLGPSYKGSTLMKVKMTIKVDDIVKDKFITRPVISRGGLFTLGGDNYILDEVAEDLYLYMFEPSRDNNETTAQ